MKLIFKAKVYNYYFLLYLNLSLTKSSIDWQLQIKSSIVDFYTVLIYRLTPTN